SLVVSRWSLAKAVRGGAVYPPRTRIAGGQYCTVARIPSNGEASGIEENIFTLGRLVALRLVQQAQAFHEQALGIERRRFLGRLAVEIDLEVSLGPAEHFEDRFVACNRAIDGVFGLSLAEINFAAVVAIG